MNKHTKTAILTAASIATFHCGALGYASLVDYSLRGISKARERLISDWATSLGYEPKRAPEPILSVSERAELSALRQGLNPALIKALVHVESRGNPLALSPKGAIGPAQIMPANHKRCNLPSPGHLLDPQLNLDCGAKILREELDKYQDLPTALQVYNGGPKCINRCTESVNYSRAVLARLARDIGGAAPAKPKPVETITEADRRKLTEIINRKG